MKIITGNNSNFIIVRSLVKKTDCDTKISEIENEVIDHNHGKYNTTREFNILAARVFNTRLTQANLVTKTAFDVKLQILMLNYKALIKRLTQTKNICLLKLN